MICEPRDEKNLAAVESLIQKDIPRITLDGQVKAAPEDGQKDEKPKQNTRPKKDDKARKDPGDAPAQAEKPKREPKERSGRKGGSNNVVGMGDHMPSFIAKSFEERRADQSGDE